MIMMRKENILLVYEYSFTECISFRNALITSLENMVRNICFKKHSDMQGISMEFNIQKYEPQKHTRVTL